MKIIKSLFLFSMSLSILSCKINNQKAVSATKARQTEMVTRDTDRLNFEDQYGRRQGNWIFENDYLGFHLPGYGRQQIIKEGNFVNDTMEGKWIFYNPDGEKTIVRYHKDWPE